jgi:hypothetical protein
MKRICESWLNESSNPNINNIKSSKNDKKGTKITKNPYKNKVKIECLLCSGKKLRENKKKTSENNTVSYMDEYIDDFALEDYKYDNSFNKQNLNEYYHDFSEKNLSDKVYFYDKKNYYIYNNSDIKDVLSFPNVNNSFSLMENNEIPINKIDQQQNEKEGNNLIKLDVFDNLFRANIKYKMN